MSTKKQSPKKEYRVYANQVMYQDVEAESAEEAYSIAEEELMFEPCESSLTLDPEVKDLDTDEFIQVGIARTVNTATSSAPITTTGNFMVYGKNGERIAAFACESDKLLFAIAPELLDVLKQVAVAMEDGSINDTGSSIPYFVASVIAKATGTKNGYAA